MGHLLCFLSNDPCSVLTFRTSSFWWDRQYVWSTRGSGQHSREMMFHEVPSCAAIYRDHFWRFLGTIPVIPRFWCHPLETVRIFWLVFWLFCFGVLWFKDEHTPWPLFLDGAMFFILIQWFMNLRVTRGELFNGNMIQKRIMLHILTRVTCKPVSCLV